MAWLTRVLGVFWRGLCSIPGGLVALCKRIPGAFTGLIGSIREGGGTLRRGIPEQVTRLGFVAVLGLTAVLSVRAYLVPKRLKDVPFDQEVAMERERARGVKFAGASACAECHDDKVAEKAAGHHRTLACETCHGACYEHTQDPGGDFTPYAPRLRDFCVRCHAYDPSRPTGFPQINPSIHNPLKACIECHKPHAPVPPNTPQECEACHGEIAKTKAVSAHATLSCTICHENTDAHKDEPHKFRPTKPETREFCGKCHAPGSENKAAPKVDIVKHGEKYLCWECHYPHMPEGR